jgi:hypothetical protein
MARYDYERLSVQDNSFLLFEEPGLYMHVSATQIFELGPLASPDGGVDYERIRAFIGAVLHRIPRYRQKLACSRTSGSGSRCSATTGSSTGASTRTRSWSPTCRTS